MIPLVMAWPPLHWSVVSDLSHFLPPFAASVEFRGRTVHKAPPVHQGAAREVRVGASVCLCASCTLARKTHRER